MGFFSGTSKKPSKGLIGEKLINMGILFKEFSYDNLEPEEISLDSELTGVIRSMGGAYDDVNGFFDGISISDYKNGTKYVLLDKIGIADRDIKNVVDFLYKYLGEDYLYRGEFTSGDLQNIRDTDSLLMLRKWEYDDFLILFSCKLKTGYMSLVINDVSRK